MPTQPVRTHSPGWRRSTDSVKYVIEGAEHSRSVLPLGMADMEVETPAFVMDALRRRLEHPALGYTLATDRSRRIVAEWYQRRWAKAVDPAWVVLMPVGPKAALGMALQAARRLRPDRGRVHLLDLEYAGIHKVAAASGHDVVVAPRAPEPSSTLGPLLVANLLPGDVAILSNPHNPTGTVWGADEIAELSARAASVGACLISDEVHGDLTHRDRTHPVAVGVAGTANNAVVTLGSVGKSFNCSGLAGSYLIVPDEERRRSIVTELDRAGMHEGGLMPLTAQDAALSHGAGWLDELISKLMVNAEIVRDVIGVESPEVVRHVPSASFLYWLDFSRLADPPADLAADLLASTGLYLMDGRRFGASGTSHLRLNFAADEKTVITTARRIADYVRRRRT